MSIFLAKLMCHGNEYPDSESESSVTKITSSKPWPSVPEVSGTRGKKGLCNSK